MRPAKEGSPVHTATQQSKRHSLTTLSQHIQQPAPVLHRRSLDSNTAEADLQAVGAQAMSPWLGDVMTQSMPAAGFAAAGQKTDIGTRLENKIKLSSLKKRLFCLLLFVL